MKKNSHAPDLSVFENVEFLPERVSPYWNILEYCRHIGVEKHPLGKRNWVARIRRRDGNYKQTRLGKIDWYDSSGISFDEALDRAKVWFQKPEIAEVASDAYPVGVTRKLNYIKKRQGYTVGDAMQGFIEWKRIAGARTYFETTLSLVNHHIIPRLGDSLVVELSNERLRDFCVDILETAPKRGNQKQRSRTKLEDLDHEALRKRKKTVNTLLGILRMAIQMAWENGDVESELIWRKIRRLPHAESPRQLFLTRDQAKRLIAACRPDLAKLVLAALYTGCRVSELSRLKARDVGGHVFGIYVAPMKSYRGRYVVLPDEGMSFFLDLVEGLNDEDLVFTMASGNSWAGSHKHLFKEAVRRAQLPDGFVFHGLRHTYASQLVQAGTPLAVVARQLGHSNTDTVSRTYGHLCCDSIEAEMSKRFAPLKTQRNDNRLADLRATLQNKSEPVWSWPQKNNSKAGGELVTLLRDREYECRDPSP